MAPKKAGKGDAAAAAKAAEEEQRRKEQEEQERLAKEEQERKVKEEAERLKRIEEEDRKRREEYEQLIQRQEEERQQEAEERRQREREREIQQLQLLEEKDREIAGLQSQILVINRQYLMVQQDLERETKGSSILQSDMELAQQTLSQYMASVANKEDEFTRRTHDLRVGGERAQLKVEQLTRDYTNMKEAYEKLHAESTTEISQLKEDLDILERTKEKDETESAMLMQLLHTELDKYKAQATQLEADLDRRHREDVKHTIMLGLLNSQIDQHCDENQSLSDVVHQQKNTIDKLEQQLQAEQQKRKALEQEQERLEAELKSKTESFEDQIAALKQLLDETTSLNGRLQADMDLTKTKYLELQEDAAAATKKAFEQKILLQSEVDAHRAQAEKHKAALETYKKEHAAAHAALQAELDTVQGLYARAQEAGEASHAKDFETITSLQTKGEDLAQHNRRLLEELARKSKQWDVEKVDLAAEAELHKSKLRQEQEIAAARERHHFETTTRLQKEVEVLTDEEAALQQKLQQANEAAVAKEVQHNTEMEALQLRLEQQKASAAEAKQQHEAQVSELEAQWAAHKADFEAQVAEWKEKHRFMVERRQKTKGKKQQFRSNAAALEQRLQEQSEAHGEYTAQMQAVEDKLRTEIAGYRDSIAKLEADIKKNYNFKLLAGQNEFLKSDVEAFRNQNLRLQDTMADMQAEIDRLAEANTTGAYEQNKAVMARVRELERDHRMLQPLMSELIHTIQRHHLDGTLKSDIETYKAGAFHTRAASPVLALPTAGAVPPLAANLPSPTSTADQSKFMQRTLKGQLTPISTKSAAATSPALQMFNASSDSLGLAREAPRTRSPYSPFSRPLGVL
uniref:Uncharacterized protein n=1 Tax=Eutreptiella gymnastica TaxID=73025 RepID=A0A7S1I8R8_9EUGL|mmetsp:Transcript_139392/g.242381  ORF Transcript_139392/g.242381 Transcript_139392/m.242381 type:complete len:858 (+) Transcript_139392:114-2687(+)